MPPLTNLELELGAHILGISSTHEYYLSTKYELLTPTLSLSTVAYLIFINWHISLIGGSSNKYLLR